MRDCRRIALARCKLYPFKLLDWKISGALIVAGKDWILSGEDFRKSKAQRQTVGSSESMNFRKVENRGISSRPRNDDDDDFSGYWIRDRVNHFYRGTVRLTPDRSPSSNIQSKFTKRQAAEWISLCRPGPIFAIARSTWRRIVSPEVNPTVA